MKSRKQLNKDIKTALQRYTNTLELVPKYAWGLQEPNTPPPLRVWRSQKYLVQEYCVNVQVVRLSIQTTKVAKGFKQKRQFEDGISWDVLQKLKRECGYGDRDAVEIYPKDADIVNVANMRHLFVYLKETLKIAWRN